MTCFCHGNCLTTSSLRRISRFCRILRSHSAIALACFRNSPVRSCNSAFHSLIIYKKLSTILNFQLQNRRIGIQWRIKWTQLLEWYTRTPCFFLSFFMYLPSLSASKTITSVFFQMLTVWCS